MNNTDRIKGFDGLRAIAVTLVFLHHETHLGIYDIGSYGVLLFFVLSGFLIINILYRYRIAIENSGTTFATALSIFLRRRAIRIFPIYYLLLLLTLPLFPHMHTASGRQFALPESLFNFAYLSNLWIGLYCGEFVGAFSHLWSLSIEEQFYIFSSILLLYLPSRMAQSFCLFVIIVSAIVRIFLELSHSSQIAIYTNSIVNFGLIAWGGFIALWSNGSRHKTLFGKIPANIIVLAYILMPFVMYNLVDWAHDKVLSQLIAPIIGLALVSIKFNQQQLLVTLLEFSPIKYIGRISYGIYLYHNFTTYHNTQTILWHLTSIQFALPPYAQALFSAAATLTVATISWNWIEKPLMRAWAIRPPRAH